MPDKQDIPESAGIGFRLDMWLWQARFFKSRAVAADRCRSGYLRRNGQPVSRAAAMVHLGDILTIPLHGQVRVVRVLAFGTRRGPANEAATLYDDIPAP